MNAWIGRARRFHASTRTVFAASWKRTFITRYARPSVPLENRLWLEPDKIEAVREAISSAPIDICYGGWGQDGHVAYNQARRHPYHPITIEELRNCTIRVQENNYDTIIALADRDFWQCLPVVPPNAGDTGDKESCLQKRFAYSVTPEHGNKLLFGLHYSARLMWNIR